jgi:tetratricopeptide (TPR) repeat protein
MTLHLSWPLRLGLAILTAIGGFLWLETAWTAYQADTALNQARALQHQGQADRALRVLETAQRLASGNAELALEAGNLHLVGYLLEGEPARLEEGIGQYSRATQLNPLEPFYPASLGQALLLAGRFDRAEEALERALPGDPHNLEYLWWMGRAKEGQGDLRAAREFLRRALEVREDPRVRADLLRLGEMLSTPRSGVGR